MSLRRKPEKNKTHKVREEPIYFQDVEIDLLTPEKSRIIDGFNSKEQCTNSDLGRYEIRSWLNKKGIKVKRGTGKDQLCDYVNDPKSYALANIDHCRREHSKDHLGTIKKTELYKIMKGNPKFKDIINARMSKEDLCNIYFGAETKKIDIDPDMPYLQSMTTCTSPYKNELVRKATAEGKKPPVVHTSTLLKMVKQLGYDVPASTRKPELCRIILNHHNVEGVQKPTSSGISISGAKPLDNYQTCIGSTDRKLSKAKLVELLKEEKNINASVSMKKTELCALYFGEDYTSTPVITDATRQYALQKYPYCVKPYRLSDPRTIKVETLKKLLDDAGITYESKDRKPVLCQKYLEHVLGRQLTEREMVELPREVKRSVDRHANVKTTTVKPETRRRISRQELDDAPYSNHPAVKDINLCSKRKTPRTNTLLLDEIKQILDHLDVKYPPKAKKAYLCKLLHSIFVAEPELAEEVEEMVPVMIQQATPKEDTEDTDISFDDVGSLY